MRNSETKIGIPQPQKRKTESDEATKVGMGIHTGNSLTEGEVRALERMRSRKKDETQILTPDEVGAIRKMTGMGSPDSKKRPTVVQQDTPEVARIRRELKKFEEGRPTKIVDRVDKGASYRSHPHVPSKDDTQLIDLAELRAGLKGKGKKQPSEKEKPGLLSRFLSLFK